MWLGYNLDDSCVYLSWMRQAHDGSLRALNLFTTDSQRGTLLNPFFLLLGGIARLTGLPLIAVYHLARLGCGGGLLLAVWKLIRLTIADLRARKLAFLCVCFASGLGWLPGLWELSPLDAPIDAWQPEAVTFLSLYLNPLFCVSLLLQVVVLALLFQGERTGKIKYAVWAGVCGFALALVHTYDIISLSAVWAAYLLASLIAGRNQARAASAFQPGDAANSDVKPSGSLLRALCAGAITLPAVLIIYRELKAEAVFQQRANVVTASPAPGWLLAGYGATLALAVYGVFKMRRVASAAGQHSDVSPHAAPEPSNDASAVTVMGEHNRAIAATTGADAARLLIVWAVANTLAAYLPVSLFPFQRKMLQGAHIPLAILAGVGLAYLLTTPGLMRQARLARLMVPVVLLLLGLTNIRFMARDIANYRDNHAMTQQRPYLNVGELDALEWISRNAPPDAAIQPLPWVTRVPTDQPDRVRLSMSDMSLACFTPGLIRRAVYCGHWGETPDYAAKLDSLTKLMRPNFPDDQRRELLAAMKIKYVIFSQKNAQTYTLDAASAPFTPLLADPVSVPPYFTLVHSNSDADVYAVAL